MPSTRMSTLFQFPDQIRKTLSSLYKRRKQLWLSGGDTWPLVVPLNIPSESQASDQLEELRSWILAWKQWGGPGGNRLVRKALEKTWHTAAA